jgi:hypothetical protein
MTVRSAQSAYLLEEAVGSEQAVVARHSTEPVSDENGDRS